MAEAPGQGRPFERLGDYDVLAPVSEGGMASVWLGRRTGTPADFVAIKVIRPEHARNKEFVAMLIDEAGIASRLAHTNIVAMRGFGVAQDGTQQPFLVMELLRGHTLLETFKTLHARGKRLPVEVVAWIGARVADALHYAHELTDDGGAPLHIVHRDVNPANVFLTSEGVPKLIDFGLAKARDRIASTAIGVVKGKLAYLAPEQAHGRPADRRSDVFALGITLWELSLDRRLFLDESDVQTVRRIREAEVPDPRTIDESYPPELAQVLLRALAKDPEQRWQSAGELRDALDAFLKSTRPDTGPAGVRAALAETFASKAPAAWERLVDDAIAEHQATRVWEERESDEKAAPAPVQPAQTTQTTQMRTEVFAVIPPAPRNDPPPSTNARPREWQSSPLLLGLMAAVGVAGAIVGGFIARGCGGHGANSDVEKRVARLEDLLGVADAGSTGPPGASAATVASGAVSADEPPVSCAEAKIASWRAWQEAVAKAKTNAQPAEAACAGIWSDSKKQACYRSAMAPIRAAQAARDAVIEGGQGARDAVGAVKDDPKNEAIARARAASAAAFDACGEDAGPDGQ